MPALVPILHQSRRAESRGPAWAFSLKNEHIVVELDGKIGGGLAFQIVPWLAVFSGPSISSPCSPS